MRHNFKPMYHNVIKALATINRDPIRSSIGAQTFRKMSQGLLELICGLRHSVFDRRVAGNCFVLLV
jgi:hypothetical protein